MNILPQLIISGLLIQIWVLAILAAYWMQHKETVPRRLENPQLVRLLSPLFYVIPVAIVAYWFVTPIQMRSVPALILSLVPIAALGAVTLGPNFSGVRTTAGGRALCVSSFVIIAAIALPIGFLVI